MCIYFFEYNVLDRRRRQKSGIVKRLHAFHCVHIHILVVVVVIIVVVIVIIVVVVVIDSRDDVDHSVEQGHRKGKEGQLGVSVTFL